MSEYHFKSKKHIERYMEQIGLDHLFSVEIDDLDNSLLVDKETKAHILWANLEGIYYFLVGFKAGMRYQDSLGINDDEQ